MLAKIKKLFSAKRRKLVYGGVTVVMLGLMAFNYISAEELDSAVSNAAAAIAAVTSLMAYLNTDGKSED